MKYFPTLRAPGQFDSSHCGHLKAILWFRKSSHGMLGGPRLFSGHEVTESRGKSENQTVLSAIPPSTYH